MDKLFNLAEKEMLLLRNPYVGTEHFFLAYLKEYGSNIISYDVFKQFIKEIIGSSYKMSDYILYTPILRYTKNNFKKVGDALGYILSNENSIVYNILHLKGVDIESILKELEN